VTREKRRVKRRRGGGRGTGRLRLPLFFGRARRGSGQQPAHDRRAHVTNDFASRYRTADVSSFLVITRIISREPRSRRGEIMRERGDRGVPRACRSRLGERRRERERESTYTRYNVSDTPVPAALIKRCTRDTAVTTYTGHYSRARARVVEGRETEDGAGIIRGIFKLDSLIACRLIRRLDSRSRVSRIARDKDEDGDEDGDNDVEMDPRHDRAPYRPRRPILIRRINPVNSLHSERVRDTCYQRISADGRVIGRGQKQQRVISRRL